MNEIELKEVLGINDIHGIILGKLNGDIVKLPFDSYFNKNITVFGSSRQYENNQFFIDKFIRTL